MSKVKGNLALLQGNKASKDGNYTEAENKYVEAIENYKKSIIEGDSTTTTKDNLGSAYLNLSVALLQLKKYAEATANLEQAISEKYESKEIYLNLGVSNLNDEKSADAVKNLQKSIDLGNKDADCFYNLGLALRVQGKFEEAAKNFKEAQKTDANDDVITALAYTYCKIIESGCTTQQAEEAFAYFTSLSEAEQKNNKDYGSFIAKHLASKYLTDNKQTETKDVINKAKIFDLKEDDLLLSLKDFALHKYTNSKKEDSLKMLFCLKDVPYQPAEQTLSEICLHNNKEDLAIKILAGDVYTFTDFTDLI